MHSCLVNFGEIFSTCAASASVASPGPLRPYVVAVGRKPPALVIFDCDGVLVDTERLAVPIDVEILTELGWAISAAEVAARFLGKSAADVKREIEEHLGRPVPPEISFEHESRYREAFERDLRPVEGVVRVLDSSRQLASPRAWRPAAHTRRCASRSA